MNLRWFTREQECQTVVGDLLGRHHFQKDMSTSIDDKIYPRHTIVFGRYRFLDFWGTWTAPGSPTVYTHKYALSRNVWITFNNYLSIKSWAELRVPADRMTFLKAEWLVAWKHKNIPPCLSIKTNLYESTSTSLTAKTVNSLPFLISLTPKVFLLVSLIRIYQFKISNYILRDFLEMIWD